MKFKSKIELLEEMIKRSTLVWIKNRGIKNEKGELIEFDKHRFLLDIFTDEAKEIAIRKGSQVGVSTFAILKELHDAIYLGINQIHTLPNDKDVWEFVPTKVDKIIRENVIKLEKDSASIKGIGKAFIYYKGTFSEAAPIMISADRLIIDEVDKSKQDIIRDYSSRLGFSKLNEKIYLSTPTLPDFGIDRIWNQSDQKHWRIDCPHCKHEQHMEWDKNVDIEQEKYVCQKCRQELTTDAIKDGRWVAKYPGREISGYWIPQMIASWRTAKDLIKEFKDADSEQYFYNFILGQPYMSSETQVPVGFVYKNLTSEKNDERNCAMGVDVQLRELYVIIGNEKGIFGIAKIQDKPEKSMWDRLAELVEVYDVRVGVIDAEYSTNDVLEFAKRFPYKIYMHFHRLKLTDPQMIKFEDEGKFTDKQQDFEEEIKVLSDINRVQDEAVANLKRGKVRFNFKINDGNLEEFISHLKTMYVSTVTDKLGQERREWHSTSNRNHYWDAYCEFSIASLKKARISK